MFLEFDLNISKNSISATTPLLEFSKNIEVGVDSCGYFECNKDYYTKREGLTEYLILFTISGEGILKYEGKTFNLKPHSLIIIDCEKFQEYKTLNNFWNFYFIHTPKGKATTLFNLILQNNFFYTDIEEVDALSVYFENIIKLKNLDTIENMLIAYKYALNILIYLYQNKLNNNKLIKKSNELVDNALGYISINFKENIQIKDICKYCNVSEFYFIRIFKNFTSTTPYEYIKNLKINYSKKLLLSTNNSIEYIAETIGYINPSSFIRAFKEVTKTTPQKFRKANDY